MSTHGTTVQAYNHAKMQTCKLANLQTYKRTTSKHASKKNTNVQTFKHTNVHTLHYNRRQYATLHYTTLPHLALHYLTSLYILSSVLIISVEYFFQRTQPEKRTQGALELPLPIFFSKWQETTSWQRREWPRRPRNADASKSTLSDTSVGTVRSWRWVSTLRTQPWNEADEKIPRSCVTGCFFLMEMMGEKSKLQGHQQVHDI